MLSFGEIHVPARTHSQLASHPRAGALRGTPACLDPNTGHETALYLRFALPTSGALLYFCWISSLKALRPSRIVGICAVRNFSAFLCEASDGSLAVNLTS